MAAAVRCSMNMASAVANETRPHSRPIYIIGIGQRGLAWACTFANMQPLQQVAAAHKVKYLERIARHPQSLEDLDSLLFGSRV
ncbi:hypothetical protein EsH8_I_000098 [Colletotrichum jinshuiense]